MFNYNDDDENSYDNISKMPIYKKAWEIMELGSKIGTLISKDDVETADEIEGEMIESYASRIVENSIIIPSKIIGAEDSEIYDLRMENAAFIRKAAREILTCCTGLQLCGYQEGDFIDLLRSEISDFRILFAEWVKTFDKRNYIIDRWGLFNPPGVNYDDPDPMNDLPFDPDDFLD